ncbi:Glucose-6-phosphate exchanger SLC37A2 [Hondaea fermentalgiana]|uniref:Glucose-6-phosphate exchanger SLC37A2 n=1 Tax=Hondaea fermentalgiana TaxID=2315210 RepID=A0A2R5GER3_9STRA|nr:Glucose-6-phosphate exchanger SLC37A2 [Hondaea fermentalgiana]|eukprot:GBG29426.1 Glucose-6-phosphate exchanger SLC37A2 [Hondaea fermentalgiana]
MYPLRYKVRVFLLTFAAYTCFHLTRKVPSVLKGVLHPQSSSGISAYDRETNPGWAPFNQDIVPAQASAHGYVVSGSHDAFDGTYTCDVDYNVSHPCEVYRKLDIWFLALVPHPHDALNVSCPLQNFTRCWVLLTTEQEGVEFAQPHGGRMPANAGSSDAPDCVHWYKRNMNTDVFEENKDIRTVPNTPDGNVLLGLLDSVFLGCYTVGLFVSGFLGDKVNLRYFLTAGMVGSALCMFMLGLAYPFQIHNLWYFVVLNVVFGLFQSTGWPSVVAVMGSWFGHGSRGLIMGIWNAHTSLGNILGSIVTAWAIGEGMHHEDWPLGYTVPGVVMLVCGLAVFALLIPHPEDVGLTSADLLGGTEDDTNDGELESPLLHGADGHEDDVEGGRAEASNVNFEDSGDDADDDNSRTIEDATTLRARTEEEQARMHDRVSESSGAERLADEPRRGLCSSFGDALSIPGLIPFALSLMFSKMCAYSILFWGPFYLGSLGFSSSHAGYLCSFFDIGGVLGGITAGFLSDRLQARGLVAFIFQLCGVPAMWFYYTSTSALGPKVMPNIWLLILVGFFINAPYALITTAVSADLGTQVHGKSHLLALVTGIIDGTGSFGAMLQGILVGYVSSTSWAEVWQMLMLAQILSAIMIAKLVYREVAIVCSR